MPGGDRTGPRRRGSRTGRGSGFCRGSRVTNPDAAAEAQITGGDGREDGDGSRCRRRRRWRSGLDAAEPTVSQVDTVAMDAAKTPDAASAETTAAATQQQLAGLQEQADKLAVELDEIRKRIREI